MTQGDRDGDQSKRGLSNKGRFVHWEIAETQGEDAHTLNHTGSVTIELGVELSEPLRRGHHGIALRNHEQQLIWGWAVDDLKLEPGVHKFRHTFPTLPVRPGPYSWHVSLYNGDGQQIDAWDCMPLMVVAAESHQHRDDRWSGTLNLASRFEIKERPDA